MRVFWGILLLPLIVSCGDTKTLGLAYTVTGADAPDLVVIVSSDSVNGGTAFVQNIQAFEGKTFYDQPENLKKCALSSKSLVLNNVTSFGTITSGVDSDCVNLASYYTNNIFYPSGDTALEVTNSGTSNFKLKDTSNGYVFVLFFFNANSSAATTRCFQIYTAEVRGGRIVDRALGQETLSDSISVSNIGMGQGNCINYRNS